MRISLWFSIILGIFLTADLSWSFWQHGQKPLDGDMPRGIVPSEDVRPVLADPFGIRLFSDKRRYQNPNRYFVHRVFHDYFRFAPRILQRWFPPIDSVYLAAALAKLLIQGLLLLLMALIVLRTLGLSAHHLILATAIIAPFFQTNGYRSYMGIIDSASTYTFHYALPSSGLLLGILALFSVHKVALKPWSLLLFFVSWCILGLAACFSGPLNPPLIILAVCLFAANYLKQSIFPGAHYGAGRPGALPDPSTHSLTLWFMILIWFFMAVYSMWLGTFSVEDADPGISVSNRYQLLLSGIGKILTGKLGLPLLIGSLVAGYVMLRRERHDPVSQKLLSAFHWFGLFALLWLALLPWGGYRIWRPYFIRYDTILPLTLGMTVLYASSAMYLLKSLSGSRRIAVICFVTAMGIIYTLADGKEANHNACERLALEQLSEAKTVPVRLAPQCLIISWKPITRTEESDMISRLLVIWGITSEPRPFFQAPDDKPNGN